MPTLAGYGEDRLVSALLERLPPSVRGGAEIVTGAGDDCAVVRLGHGTTRLQLLKTDCIIEGVHYTSETPPEKIGWKALCRPLSDIAAMGGQPLHALVTLALPGTAPLDYATAIYDGLGRAAERFSVKIVGGETARSPAAGFLSVALTGLADADKLATRAGGVVGDRIYVTGRLGGSFANGKHLDFVPRLEEARWLLDHFPVSAMMDLSDGLSRDLVRLATASGIGYTVDRSAMPCSAMCNVEQALTDGEDYELLFTVRRDACKALDKQWRAAWANLELTEIGELTEPGIRSGLEPGGGYDHFAISG